MDISKLPLFKAMSQRLDWLTQRQEVLGQNISNANTPNYQPHDLVQFNFRDLVSDAESSAGGGSPHLRPYLTNDRHMGVGMTDNKTPTEKRLTDREVYETKPTGNSVILEEQMKKSMETAMDFQMITNLYKKQIGLLKMAVSSRV
jgi:flagellar basal-body rod protein FlgB